MRWYIVMVAGLTLACASGKSGGETGETAGGGDSGSTDDSGTPCSGGAASPALLTVDLSCTQTTCTYTVESDGIIGSAELFLAETGDPSSTCGPSKGLSDCGFWEEHHTQFAWVSSSVECGDVFSLTVDLVDDFSTQANNESTLFDLNDSTVEDQLTVMVIITDGGGAYTDCAVYGDDPSYYSGDCSNRW